MSKIARKAANRSLAAALRAHGLTPNGQTWADAKALIKEGVSVKVAASVIARLHEQEPELAATRGKVTTAPVSQVPAPARKLSSRAKEVKAGLVERDAKGRLLPGKRQVNAQVSERDALVAAYLGN